MRIDFKTMAVMYIGIYFLSVLIAKNNSVPKLFCHHFVSYSCDETLNELN